jgi:biopolymer transport protein ExbB
MISRFAGFLACLAMTAEPALAQSPNPLLPRNLSPWGMFLNADIVVKAVMIGLASLRS